MPVLHADGQLRADEKNSRTRACRGNSVKKLLRNGSDACYMEAREGEGGATPTQARVSAASMTGTPSQVEWAERIQRQVDAEFDRVAASSRAIADKQSGERRADTEAVIGILEQKRTEAMGRKDAGYFIHDWQEISDQVRQMIFHDPRYQAIKSKQAARPR
jgi:hypothetical protein